MSARGKTPPPREKAVQDGWVPGKTLFSLEEAAARGTVIEYLLSDAGQKSFWPKWKPHLSEGKTLFFSHGFFRHLWKFDRGHPSQCRRCPGRPQRVRALSAAELPGRKRDQFQLCRLQDFTGKAEERCLALGIAIGSGYLFETTFEKEVYSDLTGERGVLMGAIAGIMEAQYYELRKHGHSPSEAFNETVEEFTQSLIRLAAEKGMDWLYANCSTTAQRAPWTGREDSGMRSLPFSPSSISGWRTAPRPKSSWSGTASPTTGKS